MESKAGSILLLIAGIIGIIGSIVVLITELIFFFFADGAEQGVFVIVVSLILFIVILIISLLKLKASKMMKDSFKVKNGAILGLLLGIFSLDIIAIAGGIVGIIQAGN